MKTLFAIA
jgi:hypothetical protein